MNVDMQMMMMTFVGDDLFDVAVDKDRQTDGRTDGQTDRLFYSLRNTIIPDLVARW